MRDICPWPYTAEAPPAGSCCHGVQKVESKCAESAPGTSARSWHEHEPSQLSIERTLPCNQLEAVGHGQSKSRLRGSSILAWINAIGEELTSYLSPVASVPKAYIRVNAQ